MENPGCYFHLEPLMLEVYAGMHIFDKLALKMYRESVVHPKYGEKLVSVIEEVKKIEDYEIFGKHYKRVPRRYDPKHRNAEFLLHNGIGAGYETAIPGELFTEEIIDYCYE